MSRKAKFYVATLAAAVQRAAQIAPNKGVAYDKAHGCVMSIDAETKIVTIRSTNIEVFYRERIMDVVDVGDSSVEWRVNAELLNGIVQGLPIDKEVTFSQHEGEEAVRITCGRKRASVRLSDASTYPTWPPVEDTGMLPVPRFGQKVVQVSWAVDSQALPFTGVHIDGERLTATDRYRLAQVQLEVPIEEKVTVPLSVLAPILKNLPGDARIRADDKQLHMLIGEEIEVSCVLLDGTYPDVSKPFRTNFSVEVTVDREALIDAIQKMLVLVKNERYPVIYFSFTKGTAAIHMTVPQLGDMDDEISIDYDGDEFQIMYTPDFLLKALEGSEQKKIKWEMGPDRKLMTRITDGTDYVAWVMPRRSTGDEEDS